MSQDYNTLNKFQDYSTNLLYLHVVLQQAEGPEGIGHQLDVHVSTPQ
jgi:hypothetical protein